MLIGMEAKKSSLLPFCNNFSKNAIEERITSIIKPQKFSLLSIIVGLMLIIVMVTACAVTAPDTQNNDSDLQNKEYVDNTSNDPN